MAGTVRSVILFYQHYPVSTDILKGSPRYGQCTRYLAGLRVGQKVTVSIKPSVMKVGLVYLLLSPYRGIDIVFLLTASPK